MNYFKKSEIQCKCGCGIYYISVDLIQKMNWVRENYCKPIIVTSACRCLLHNKKVGGKPNSAHITTLERKGLAMDFRMPDNSKDMYRLLDLLFVEFERIGINNKKNNRFIHVDVSKILPANRFWFY